MDNDKLDHTDVLSLDSVYVGMPAQFPGIELQNELEVRRLFVTSLAKLTGQDVHGAVEIAGHLNTPTNKAPSSVDNIIVINLTSDDNEDAIIVHECKLEGGSPNYMANNSISDVVQCDDLGDITTEDNPLLEGMGSYANTDGQ